MRNGERWRPSKFVLVRGRLRASPDPRVVGRGSRFVAGRKAPIYQRIIEGHARGRLLDLGCGRVPFFGVYGDLVEECVCVDWEHSLHEDSHVDLTTDLNRPLALPSASFDTILLTEVLEHIARPEDLWAEIARLLRPGGKLILTVPFLYWIHEAPHDHFRYTEHRLALFCRDHGLRPIHLEPTGGAPEVMLDVLAKLCGVSRILSLLHLTAARLLMALPPVAVLSRKTARRFPLGYSLVAVREASPR